jgi:hypothetical protein
MEPLEQYYSYMYEDSQKKTDVESGLSLVTLSIFVVISVNSAKGLSRWATRCFAAAQHDNPEGSQVDAHYV